MVVAALPTPYLTPEQYLEIDRHAELPNEYSDGLMYPIENTSLRHGRILTNLIRSLCNRLVDSPCEVVSSTVRVRIPGTKKYTYPDLIVTCGAADLEDSEADTLLNPTVLFEILSPNTADYDRGTKAEWYRTIPSLKAYVVVAQDRIAVTRFKREGEHTWLVNDLYGTDESLDIDSIGCSFPLAEIYRKIELDQA